MLHPCIRIRQERYILLIILLPLLEEGGTLSLGEAMISGAGGGIGGKIYKWKRYELNRKTVYTWDKYNAVIQTLYKWNKWNLDNPTYTAYERTANFPTWGFESSETLYTVFTSWTYNGYWFEGIGNRGTIGSLGNGAANSWLLLTSQLPRSERLHKLGRYYGYGSTSPTASPGYMYEEVECYGNSNYQSYPDYSPIQIASNIYSKGTTSYGQVTSTSSGAYPANGASGSYWYESAGSETQTIKGSTSYGQVESESSSTYPNGGAQSGYWYENRTSRVEYSMGTYKDTVYSTSRNQYPDNGHDASYWYVFDGES